MAKKAKKKTKVSKKASPSKSKAKKKVGKKKAITGKTTKKSVKKSVKKATTKSAKKTTKKTTTAKKNPKNVMSSATVRTQLQGQVAPKFSGLSTAGGTFNNSQLPGKWTVLYFYPKDNTSGCTKESQDFRDSFGHFTSLNTEVIGVSPDSLLSHQKFKAQHGFPFELLSDEDKSICQAFGVWKEKNMYGRLYWGVERSTFLISPEGIVVKEWRKVKVPGHVEEVLTTLKSLQT